MVPSRAQVVAAQTTHQAQGYRAGVGTASPFYPDMGQVGLVNGQLLADRLPYI